MLTSDDFYDDATFYDDALHHHFNRCSQLVFVHLQILKHIKLACKYNAVHGLATKSHLVYFRARVQFMAVHGNFYRMLERFTGNLNSHALSQKSRQPWRNALLSENIGHSSVAQPGSE